MKLCQHLSSGGKLLRKSLSLPVLTVTLLCISLASAPLAFSDAEQGLRFSTAVTVDGSFVQIHDPVFGPDNGSCVVYVATLTDPASFRQVESGVVRCNGTSLDGSCSGVKYVEVLDNHGYNCFPHGSFLNSESHAFKVVRNLNGAQVATGYVDGQGYEQGGGFLGNAFAGSMAEYTRPDAVDCTGWSGTEHFANFQRFIYGSGWDYVGGSSSTQCWTVGAINSTGDWNASH